MRDCALAVDVSSPSAAAASSNFFKRLIVGPRDGRVADERNGLSLLCAKWKFQCWLMPPSLSFFALWRRSTTCECGPVPGVLDLEWRIMSSQDNVAMNKATEPS
jgi:hypothetical protein